jgi:hypothetical protein
VSFCWTLRDRKVELRVVHLVIPGHSTTMAGLGYYTVPQASGHTEMALRGRWGAPTDRKVAAGNFMSRSYY